VAVEAEAVEGPRLLWPQVSILTRKVFRRLRRAQLRAQVLPPAVLAPLVQVAAGLAVAPAAVDEAQAVERLKAPNNPACL
jgi:hypothetical protein